MDENQSHPDIHVEQPVTPKVGTKIVFPVDTMTGKGKKFHASPGNAIVPSAKK